MRKYYDYDPADYEPDPPEEITCPECGETTFARTEDVGIGPYEFWGATGVDVRLIQVTNCCGVEV